jgi:16S rRNA (guanine527-N7)-methyltransferase
MNTETVLADQLNAGCAQLGLELEGSTRDRLLSFVALLVKWNKTYNLTSIRDAREMLTHHVLDSLAVLPYLKEVHGLADVGSGAGLPGLPLAMVRPDLAVDSIEASQKKAAFQQQAKIELHIANATIRAVRAEQVGARFDAAISRAFASLKDFVGFAGHLADRLFAMKGQFPAAEVDALPLGWRLAASHELNVPGLAAQRHLLVIERN